MPPSSFAYDVLTLPAKFKVVIIYESLAAGIRAQETAERLAQQLPSETEVSVSLWKFDLLNYLTMQDRPAIDAADADMLIVSAEANSKLPIQVRDGLEYVLPIQGGGARRAMVALLGHEQTSRVTWGGADVQDYL